MKRDTKLLSDLTHRIYNASLHPEQWVDAVTQIHASLQANKSILFTPYLGPQHGGIAFPVGFSQESLDIWATKFIDKDEIGKKMLQKQLFFSGNVCTDRDLFPTEYEYQAYLDSEIYCDYASHYDLHHNLVGVVFDGSPDLPASVYSAWRGNEAPAFDNDDKDWMGLLISHISRAMGIMMRLDTARLQAATLQATLNRMKFGVMLLNEELRVVHLNNAAKTILERNDGIRLNKNRFLESRGVDTRVHIPAQCQTVKKTRSNDNEQHTVASWLNACKKMSSAEQHHFMHGLTVFRKSDTGNDVIGTQRRRKYVFQFAPLPDSDLMKLQDGSAHYAVFVFDPKAAKLPCIEKLMTIYALTETEARISQAFVEHGSYKGVARYLQISENTVRWHIKNIYPKLGIYKLADLVRMVMALGESSI